MTQTKADRIAQDAHIDWEQELPNLALMLSKVKGIVDQMTLNQLLNSLEV